jgi:N-acetylneuraminic acid mutarotase
MWKKNVLIPSIAACMVALTTGSSNAAKSGSWTVINDPGEPREEATTTLLNDGRVLIAGGEGYQGVLTLVELFDPKTNTYAAGPNLSVPRDQATATLLANGDVLVVGGTSDNVNPTPLSSAAIYHPKTNTWTNTGSLHQARFGHQAVLLQDGRVLVTGGTPDVANQLTSCEIWDPLFKRSDPARRQRSGSGG